MFSVTRSSNEGHGVCCKPGFDGEHCNNDGDHQCSEPAYYTDTTNPFFNTVSEGELNHQLFAYCTSTNRNVCGIDSTSGTDMGIKANITEATIDANIQYINQITVPSVRKYESCYYEVGSIPLTEEQEEQLLEGNEEIRIKLKVNIAKEMNVYLYGGNNRLNATISMVENNDQVIPGKTYSIDYKKGMLLVAYPNTNVTTDFSFSYWLDGYKEGDDEFIQPQEEQD